MASSTSTKRRSFVAVCIAALATGFVVSVPVRAEFPFFCDIVPATSLIDPFATDAPLPVDPNAAWLFVDGEAFADDMVMDMSNDRFGNLYLTGEWNQGVIGETLRSAYLSKLDTHGRQIYRQPFRVADSRETIGRDLAYVAPNLLYVAGYAVFDPDEGNNFNSAFVARFEATSGALNWLKLVGAPGEFTLGNAVGVDSDGNVYVGGGTFTSLDDQPLIGSQDAFIKKFTPNGDATKTLIFGTQNRERITDIFIHYDVIYATGATDGPLFGQALRGTDDGDDAFVTAFNTDLEEQWTTIAGANGTDAPKNINIDHSDNLLVTGRSDCGQHALKLDRNGNILWERFLKGGGVWGGWAVAADGQNNVWIVDQVSPDEQDKMELGSTFAGGSSDMLITRFNETGTHTGTFLFGTDDGGATEGAVIDSALAVLIEPFFGRVVIAGATNGEFPGQIDDSAHDNAVVATLDIDALEIIYFDGFDGVDQ